MDLEHNKADIEDQNSGVVLLLVNAKMPPSPAPEVSWDSMGESDLGQVRGPGSSGLLVSSGPHTPYLWAVTSAHGRDAS